MTDIEELIKQLEHVEDSDYRLAQKAAAALAAQAQEIEELHEAIAKSSRFSAQQIRRAERAEARVRELDQQWREHCQKIHNEAYEIHGGTGKIIADLQARIRELETDNALLKANWMKGEWMKTERDAIKAETIERCAKIADFHTALRDDGDYAMGASDMAKEIAEDIRALNEVS